MRLILALVFFSLLASACSERQTEVIPDNQIPNYEGIPTILVENYINRLYIDLLGREPTDDEMAADVSFLRSGNLEKASREQLVGRLQTSTDLMPGDTSYQVAFYRRLYEQAKGRLIEGVSDEEIQQEIGIARSDALKDSLSGDSVGYALAYQKIGKLEAIIESQEAFRFGQIGIDEMYARMLDNYFYDQINMNSINFIRASFDDLFFRYPTQAEFEACFPVIEYNQPSILFGQPISNKGEYIATIIGSREYHEGMVRWAFKTLLAREPRSDEAYHLTDQFFQDKDLLSLQKAIVVTDEYANF